MSYPLGNRAAKSRLTASQLEAAQLLLDIKDLEKTIIVEVREAIRQIETNKKRVQAARVARRLAEEKLSAELKKFEVGLSTAFGCTLEGHVPQAKVIEMAEKLIGLGCDEVEHF